jgi:hypothetical protein
MPPRGKSVGTTQVAVLTKARKPMNSPASSSNTAPSLTSSARSKSGSDKRTVPGATHGGGSRPQSQPTPTATMAEVLARLAVKVWSTRNERKE